MRLVAEIRYEQASRSEPKAPRAELSISVGAPLSELRRRYLPSARDSSPLNASLFRHPNTHAEH